MMSRSWRVGKRPVADEIDGLDLGGVALVDLEHQINAIAVELDDLGLDRGRKAPLAPVDVEHALHVGLRLGAREHGPRLELYLVLERILVDFLVAFKGDLVDDRIFHDRDDDAAALAVDAHVGKQASCEQRADRLVDLARIVGVAGVEFEIGANGFGFHPLVADDADFANGPALRLRGRRPQHRLGNGQRRHPDQQGYEASPTPRLPIPE